MPTSRNQYPKDLFINWINKKNMTFSELIDSEKPVLIDFYADWCAPCRAMKPVLEDLKTKLGEKITIFKVDVEKNQSVSERFDIRSIPTLIIFKNGKPVWRKAGVASASELNTAFNNLNSWVYYWYQKRVNQSVAMNPIINQVF